MSSTEIITNPTLFSEHLFTEMKEISSALEDLEPYEFQYCLENVIPATGWQSVKLENKDEIEKRINDLAFFKNIQFNHKVDGNIQLDEQILCLTRELFVGLVTGKYEREWILEHFYFDPRGFLFMARTHYFTDKVKAHLSGKPYICFDQKQKDFERVTAVGYKSFKAANWEVDACFLDFTKRLIEYKGTPILLAIAGPTAAGKTEIVERLSDMLTRKGKKVTSIELDNFLTDRDYREAHGIDSEGKEALHFDLLKTALVDITRGRKISIPRYDFINATSSHDLSGNLKPDGIPVEVEPADIIFMEGNFPFLLDEIVDLIGIKIVYLTDDPVRCKRKWRRDMDLRKKYALNYFRNRYFKDQFIMAQVAYIPQLEVCDLVVDTTGAAIWTSPETGRILDECRKAG
jgi:uridine kinase